MKSYIPAGYFKYAGYISKDSNAQIQQDRSFYDSQKFKYRFNEDHTSYLKTPSVKYEPALPPRLKNHAAGQPSDWAGLPIPGEAKKWNAYSTLSSLKNSAEAQILSPDALARAQSSYHKKRNLEKLDHLSSTQELVSPQANKTVDDRVSVVNGLNLGGPNDDKASILTVDKLRKFNDINGYEHGPAAEGGAGEEDQEAADEQRDKVGDLASGNPNKGKGGKYLNG
jgi:hypothetical protein